MSVCRAELHSGGIVGTRYETVLFVKAHFAFGTKQLNVSDTHGAASGEQVSQDGAPYTFSLVVWRNDHLHDERMEDAV
jgi:hypothetical protein